MKKWWKRRVAPVQATAGEEDSHEIYKTTVTTNQANNARYLQRTIHTE